MRWRLDAAALVAAGLICVHGCLENEPSYGGAENGSGSTNASGSTQGETGGTGDGGSDTDDAGSGSGGTHSGTATNTTTTMGADGSSTASTDGSSPTSATATSATSAPTDGSSTASSGTTPDSSSADSSTTPDSSTAGSSTASSSPSSSTTTSALPATPGTCLEILTDDPAAADGVHTVDPDGDAGPDAPFSVYCDMTGGGWTRVAFEPTGAGADMVDAGLRFLGVETGSADDVAQGTGTGLIGPRFAGLYTELRITWGADDATMTVSDEVFANSVATAIGVSGFATSDATLAGWVGAAGGAVFCRSARSPDVLPGDTSWAVKPADDVETGCGCNSTAWVGRGAYYGGSAANTDTCTGWGGGWAGVVDTGVKKGGSTSSADLSLWIR